MVPHLHESRPGEEIDRAAAFHRIARAKQLRPLLDSTQTMDPVPELHLQPDPNARYDMVNKVLAETKKAKVSKLGFIGNEAYRAF